MHEAQLAEPVALAKVPLGHAVQLAKPVALAKVPTGQVMQEVDSVLGW